MQHHFIVATHYRENAGLTLRAWLDATITDPTERSRFHISPPTTINGYTACALTTDGSKELWPESNAGNALRARFLDYLTADGWQYLEVSYGDYGPRIEQSDDEA